LRDRGSRGRSNDTPVGGDSDARGSQGRSSPGDEEAGREKVVALLKHIELAEARKPAAIRFDVRELYEALGIERA
jgi:hypothetical protein